MQNRLVRFDWALKKLLRNKANFEILEGFLSELLKQDVRIEKILESESNKSSADDKHNRVDLLTEIGTGELVLIELQVEAQYDYFHRMVYGASKLITDYMDSGSSYDKVRKVISINIVYFDLGYGEDYVYHGTTEFRGIHNHDLLQLSASQQNQIRNHTLAPESSYEYYVLKVFNFNDRIQHTLDEWMYFFKNCKIKSEFSAKGLQKVAEELDLLKLSPEERGAYYNYIEDRRVIESSVKTAWLDGKHKGLEESKLEGKLEIAMAMVRDGESNDRIRRYTDLTDDEIDGLRENGIEERELSNA